MKFVVVIVLLTLVLAVVFWRSRVSRTPPESEQVSPRPIPSDPSTVDIGEPEPVAPAGLEDELYEGFRVVLSPAIEGGWRPGDLGEAATEAGFRRADDFWAIPAPDRSGDEHAVWLEPQVE